MASVSCSSQSCERPCTNDVHLPGFVGFCQGGAQRCGYNHAPKPAYFCQTTRGLRADDPTPFAEVPCWAARNARGEDALPPSHTLSHSAFCSQVRVYGANSGAICGCHQTAT